MNSSDRHVEERLRHALAEPMTASQLAVLDARLERGRARLPLFGRRAWRRSLVLVAAVLVVLPVAVIAGIIPGSDEVPPPPELESRVSAVFSEDTCTSPEYASAQIKAILVELGYSEWSVKFGTGAADTDCVGAGLDGQTRSVMLVMALPPEVRKGLDAVREQLYAECRSEEEARALVAAVINRAGMENWKIEAGSLALPLDRANEIERHVESGCWVYSTTGWTADGTRVFWIAGP